MREAAARKRITIRDVAEAAGASRGVVSSVLNGNRHKNTRVSEETQERIRQAAARLGYRPNALARSLQRRQTNNLLFASYFVTTLIGSGGGFFVEVLDGALDAATTGGYDLMIHLVQRGDPEKVAVLGDGRADGCLWIGPDAHDPVLPRLEGGLAWPLVTFGGRCAGVTANVIADNRHAMELAVGHLYDQGHRRLAFVNQSTQNCECVERWERFAEACAGRGITPHQIIAEQTAPDAAGRMSIVAETLTGPLSDAVTRPTGVVVFNDTLAAEILRLAPRMGLSIPRDLSVIGMDSTPFCDTLTPPLTSLYQPLQEMARHCIEILIREVDRENGADEDNEEQGEGQADNDYPIQDVDGVPIVLFPCRLDLRASTGPPPE